MAANIEKCLRIYIALSSSNDKLVKLNISMKMFVVAVSHLTTMLFYLFLQSAYISTKIPIDVLIGIIMQCVDPFVVK